MIFNNIPSRKCELKNGACNGNICENTNQKMVIVRDNVCLTYDIKDQFSDKQIISCRLEVAQVALDQATLNQLLRTQTV